MARPQAQLNEFLIRTVAGDGYASAEVHETPIRTVIINRAARTRKELSEKRATGFVRLRLSCRERSVFPENSAKHFAETVENRASCTMARAELQHGRSEQVAQGDDDQEDTPISTRGQQQLHRNQECVLDVEQHREALSRSKNVIVNSVEALMTALAQLLFQSLSEPTACCSSCILAVTCS